MIDHTLPPVAVGALGGSGTRVFARVLMGLDYYMGTWRTAADDNLLVSELLKDPEAAGGPYDQQRAVDCFVSVMQGHLPGWRGAQVVAETRRAAGKPAGTRQVAAIWRRLLQTSIGARRDHYRGWGWKEPFTHLFLEAFAEREPELRYVHVLRHGLDMAFSANLSQLVRFADRFGIEMPATRAEAPVAQLRLWVETTRRVLEVAPPLFGDRFLVMHYDDMVAEPREQIAVLAEFLGIEDAPVGRIAAGIAPTTVGRFRDRDLSIFPDDLLAAVEAQGFSISGEAS